MVTLSRWNLHAPQGDYDNNNVFVVSSHHVNEKFRRLSSNLYLCLFNRTIGCYERIVSTRRAQFFINCIAWNPGVPRSENKVSVRKFHYIIKMITSDIIVIIIIIINFTSIIFILQ
jgi:hypothetical protein